MALFGKKKSALPTSGHAGDDMVLHQMVKQGADLAEPRHWVHYLYFADESTARDAAAEVSGAGWALERVERAATDDGAWVVIAERHDVIVDPTSVREARVFLEAVVATRSHADYDGWEASL